MNDIEWLGLHGHEYWKDVSPNVTRTAFHVKYAKLVKRFAADCKAAIGDPLDIVEIEDHAWSILCGDTSPVKYSGGTSSGGYVTAEGTLTIRDKNKTTEKNFSIGTFSGLKSEDLKGNLSPEQIRLVIHWLGHPAVNPLDCKFWQNVAVGADVA